MNNFRKIVQAGLAIGAALALLTGFPSKATSATPYTIPMILSLTGTYGFMGAEENRFIQALETSVNKSGGIGGRPLHFAVEDDQSSPQVAVQLANAIIASRRPVFVGPTIAADCDAVEPLLHNGPVMYCFSPSFHPAAGTYSFAAGTSTEANIAAMVRYFRGRGVHKLALLTSLDASGQDGDRWFKRAMSLPENKDLQVVATDHFAPTDISLSAQLSHIKQSGAEALLAWTPGTAFINVIHAYTDAGLDIPVGTSTANMNYKEMEQLAEYNNRNLYFTGFRYFEMKTLRKGPLKDRVDTFYQSITPIGLKADAMAGTCWDGALIVASALRQLGPDATAPAIRDYIIGLHSFVGINGVYDFSDGSQRGIGTAAATIMHWEPKSNVWIPSSRAGGEPIARTART